MKDLHEYYMYCENGKELFESDSIDVYYGYFTDKKDDGLLSYDGIEPVSLSCDEYELPLCDKAEVILSPELLLINSIVYS